MTLVDAYLAGAVLLSLVFNILLGWWADPMTGLLIMYYSLREGWHACMEARGPRNKN